MSDPIFELELAALRDACRRLRDDVDRQMQGADHLLAQFDRLTTRLDELERRHAAATRDATTPAAGVSPQHGAEPGGVGHAPDSSQATPAAARRSEPRPPANQPVGGIAPDQPPRDAPRAPFWQVPPPPRDPAAPATAPSTLLGTPLVELGLRLLNPQRRVQAERPPRDGGSLEMAIGGTWLNRIGAVIVFLAVAFFAKFSFDQGWISPTLRAVAAGVIGAALVGLGEWFHARGHRSFAAGLLGCGVGVLYLAVFVAHEFYALIPHGAAFALYAGVTTLSIAVAVHARLLPIAVIGVLGGFLTPVLVSTGENRQVELLSYLLALDVAFLACAHLRRWDVLRILCWLGTVALFAGWADRFYSDDVAWRTAAFILAFYLLFHGESVLALRRGVLVWPRVMAHLLRADNAVFFGAMYFTLRHVAADWMGLFAVAAAGLQWATAWKLLPRSELLGQPRLTLWIDGAAMLALAAPMQFDRYLVSVSWAVQSAVTLYFCRRHGTTWLRIKAVGVWFAAAAHLLIYEYHDVELVVPMARWALWHVSWMIVLFVTVGLIAYAGVAVLHVRRSSHAEDDVVGASLLLGGTALLLGIFAAEWDRYVATMSWVVLGFAWWGVGRRISAAWPIVITILGAAVFKFVTWDTLAATAGGFWRQLAGPGSNRAVVAGLAVAGLAWACRHAADRMPEKITARLGVYPIRALLTIVSLVLLTWIGTFETARIVRFEAAVRSRFDDPDATLSLFVTAFWCMNAVVLWMFARPDRAALSAYALVLTWMGALRFLVADTLNMAMDGRWSVLRGIGRNRTFIVGLLVIGLALLAHRSIRRLGRDLTSKGFGVRSAQAALLLAVVAVAWVPTFEIARAFRFEPFAERFADPSLAMHVALSTFWSLYATALLIIGFSRRVSLVRRAALVLFAITVAKVLLVDVGYLERVYRIISFGVLGVLLLFASWLYQRLSATVLERPAGASPPWSDPTGVPR